MMKKTIKVKKIMKHQDRAVNNVTQPLMIRDITINYTQVMDILGDIIIDIEKKPNKE